MKHIKKIIVTVFSAILMGIHFTYRLGIAQLYESVVAPVAQRAQPKVIYQETTVHIIKSNYQKSETIESVNGGLENFAQFIAKLEDEPNVVRGKNSKYELGYLFRGLAGTILLQDN